MSKLKGRYEKTYEEEGTVGRGNFGYVHRIKERTTGKLWVSKKIPLDNLSAEQQEGALQEANLLRTMSHPHIVTYRESFIERDTLYIIMEYCQGKLSRGRSQHSYKEMQAERAALSGGSRAELVSADSLCFEVYTRERSSPQRP